MWGNPSKQEYENLKSELESEKEKRIRAEERNNYLETENESLRLQIRELRERENRALNALLDERAQKEKPEPHTDLVAEINSLIARVSKTPAIGRRGIDERTANLNRLTELKQKVEETQRFEERKAALTDTEREELEKSLVSFQ